MNECRVVLVRPHFAGNLGAAARVMHNFGVTRLVLVDPIADRGDIEARRLATHGESILDRAEIVPSLGSAVSDCVLVAATSAKIGGVIRQTVAGTLRELAPRVAESMARGPVAIVFGPEPSGLTNVEIGQCHFLIHIPTHELSSALNLAQAIAICLYELRLSWLDQRKSSPAYDLPAPHAEMELMFDHLRRGLEAVHFLYGPKADSLMHAIRHLINRASPSLAEVKMLHGLARQLDWTAQQLQKPDSRST